MLFLGGAETAAATPELFRIIDGQNKLFTRTASPARLHASFPSYQTVPEAARAVRTTRTLNSNELQKRADRAIQNRSRLMGW